MLLLLACTAPPPGKEDDSAPPVVDAGETASDSSSETAPTETGTGETGTGETGTGETGTTTPVSCSQEGWVTDAATYPVPPAPELAAGQTTVDPTFGTTVLRVTDAGTDPNGCVHSYSYWPVFNADQTRLVAYCNSYGTMLTDFDRDTLASGAPQVLSLRTPEGSAGRWEDVIWSKTDPDLLYVHDQRRLWTLDVVTGEWTEIRDFAPEVGDETMHQMSRGGDDDVFAWHTSAPGYLVYRDGVVHQGDLAAVDEVHLDKTGRWLGIFPGRQGAGVAAYQVLDLETDTITDVIDDEHLAPGHSDHGTGTVVGYTHWDNSFTIRSLAAPDTWTEILSFGSDWTVGNHVSILADDEEWALVSTFSVPSSTGYLHDELVLVRTDGSGEIRRAANHQSVYSEYWDSPRAALSADGCFAAFTSNWGDSGRTDVFVVAFDR